MQQELFDSREGSGNLVRVLGLLWLVASVVMILAWLLYKPTIEVRWQTETEFDTAGFNVLRGLGSEGPFARLNDGLIAASADPAAGSEYLYIDDDVVGGQPYYYRLEDVELSGNTSQHEMIMATASMMFSFAFSLCS